MPSYLCALKYIVSVLSVGMPINAIPASSVKHQFLAIVTRSPQG